MDQKNFLLKRKEEILSQQNQNALSSKTNPQKPRFENDGNFLERFKRIQKQEQEKQRLCSSAAASSTTESQPFNIVHDGDVSAECKPEINTYEIARDLAEKVSKEGIQAEMMTRIKERTNPDYQFLFDSTTPVAIFYENLKNSKKLSTNTETHQPKKQKRRWGDSSSVPLTQVMKLEPSSSPISSTPEYHPIAETTDNFLPEFEKAKALVRAKAAAIRGGAAISDVKVKSQEDERRQKEIEEQKMMNEIYLKVIQQQMAAAGEIARKKTRNADKPRYEYDSDEDTEGGTWEHKKRQTEMQKTAERALELTENSRGKHHLSDFLPPDELQKFLEKVQAVKEGREVDFSDYANYKIGEDNIGFKMLTKAGWKEGSGLGSKGEGIIAPINKGKTSFDQSGLGTEKISEVKKEDDDFEVYRKRMMLAYKFRPNPLNNPRRPYYS